MFLKKDVLLARSLVADCSSMVREFGTCATNLYCGDRVCVRVSKGFRIKVAADGCVVCRASAGAMFRMCNLKNASCAKGIFAELIKVLRGGESNLEMINIFSGMMRREKCVLLPWNVLLSSCV